jgi:hypothetical protein
MLLIGATALVAGALLASPSMAVDNQADISGLKQMNVIKDIGANPCTCSGCNVITTGIKAGEDIGTTQARGSDDHLLKKGKGGGIIQAAIPEEWVRPEGEGDLIRPEGWASRLRTT